MIAGQHWYSVKDADARAFALFQRHYSALPYADGRRKHDRRFVGPGEHMVLMTQDCRALFVWRRFLRPSPDGQEGVCCSVFRNEGDLLSSALIEEACNLAWLRWPAMRLFTYVDARKIQSSNPGYCFKMAGWQACGETKTRGLVILERKPPAPPREDK